ncbi:MAG: DUF523 domain-containing protein [Proteobacteria bacterium]|nr:DUF523 domain-containing protein [Pseudomonadota bacterium]MCP4921580.1 DUF523 domain-containing protein [Pseudomonadota bacterium]
MTLVSACLLGRACRYDGASKPSAAVRELTDVIPVCPEELLGVPRPAAELRGGDGHDVLAGRARVVTRAGVDVTDAFIEGARRCLRDVDQAVLKARSPSCGCGQTWIDGELREGDGVFAALLSSRGIVVRTDEELGC